MSLVELQRAFWVAVRTRGVPPEGLDELFEGNARQSATDRMAVYHRAYWQRQLTALASGFPRLRELLGERRFERIVLRYLERWPGTDACIERLGARLPAFLVEQPEISAIERDVAGLESAALTVLLAPDAQQINELPRHMGARLGKCRFELVPALQLESARPRALAVFGAQPSPGAPRPIEPIEPAQAPEEPAVWVAFYRRRFAVRHLALAADEARALELTQRGETFSGVCEAFAALSHEAAARRATAVLSGWLTRGWISRINNAESSDGS
jgi:hypothetical protein